MRIILIEPKAPGRHVFSTVNMPRLGLPLLGTHLSKHGHDVKIFNCSSHDIRISDIVGADLVGISTTTSTVKDAYHLADFIRSHDIKVVMGGAHVTFLAEEALEHCDYVCRGEADTTFTELVDCIARGEIPSSVAGVSYQLGDGIVHNPLPTFVDIDAVPYPDFSLFADLKKMSTYPVMTSRGCPFDCSFCSVTAMFGRKFRCRDNESVLKELEQYAGKQVFFIDDNFTANIKRAKDLLREMIKRKNMPKWWCAQVRTDSSKDDELLQLMKAAGCGMVFVGMESVNPKTLANFNKKQDVEDIERCIKKYHQLGIMVHGMFVFGADDDTPETLKDTLAFALRTRIDTVQFCVLTPLPGSRTFYEMEASGRLLTRDWNLYDAHHVVFEPLLMSASELQIETIKAFKKFYSLRYVASNFFNTGMRSVACKAAGYWMTRRWDSENKWYYGFLQSLTQDSAETSWGGRIYQSIAAFSLRRFKYISREKLVDIELSEQNGTFSLELKGYLNKFALSKTFATIKSHIPENYQNLTINIERLSFASESILLKFIKNLNSLSKQARKVNLKVGLDNNRLERILQKYDLNVPHFDIESSRDTVLG